MTAAASASPFGPPPDRPFGATAPTFAAAVPSALPPTGTDARGRLWPIFAHASEAEMARILDFYEVRWEYEPRTFPILWNLDGFVIESFSPDFYLPELDLYFEMTTLRQRLVRKKNRKLRRLRELYPDIRIKLFYARDFRAMMLKYGRLALADSLSGTLGQVVSDRVRMVAGPLDEGAGTEDLQVVDLGPEGAPLDAPARRSRRRRRPGGDRMVATIATGTGGSPTNDEEAGVAR